MKKALALSLFSLLVISSGLAAQDSAPQESDKVELKCSGNVITSDNVKEVQAYLQTGLEKAYTVDEMLKMAEEPLSGFLSAATADLERRLLFLDEYEKSGFDAEAGAGIAEKLATTDLCGPGYDCGGAGVGNSNNCSSCEYKEVSPRTNPRTCEYSCAMCCAHYGNPAGCAASCPSGDPC